MPIGSGRDEGTTNYELNVQKVKRAHVSDLFVDSIFVVK